MPLDIKPPDEPAEKTANDEYKEKLRAAKKSYIASENKLRDELLAAKGQAPASPIALTDFLENLSNQLQAAKTAMLEDKNMSSKDRSALQELSKAIENNLALIKPLIEKIQPGKPIETNDLSGILDTTNLKKIKFKFMLIPEPKGEKSLAYLQIYTQALNILLVQEEAKNFDAKVLNLTLGKIKVTWAMNPVLLVLKRLLPEEIREKNLAVLMAYGCLGNLHNLYESIDEYYETTFPIEIEKMIDEMAGLIGKEDDTSKEKLVSLKSQLTEKWQKMEASSMQTAIGSYKPPIKNIRERIEIYYKGKQRQSMIILNTFNTECLEIIKTLKKNPSPEQIKTATEQIKKIQLQVNDIQKLFDEDPSIAIILGVGYQPRELIEVRVLIKIVTDKLKGLSIENTQQATAVGEPVAFVTPSALTESTAESPSPPPHASAEIAIDSTQALTASTIMPKKSPSPPQKAKSSAPASSQPITPTLIPISAPPIVGKNSYSSEGSSLWSQLLSFIGGAPKKDTPAATSAPSNIKIPAEINSAPADSTQLLQSIPIQHKLTPAQIKKNTAIAELDRLSPLIRVRINNPLFLTDPHYRLETRNMWQKYQQLGKENGIELRQLTTLFSKKILISNLADKFLKRVIEKPLGAVTTSKENALEPDSDSVIPDQEKFKRQCDNVGSKPGAVLAEAHKIFASSPLLQEYNVLAKRLASDRFKHSSNYREDIRIQLIGFASKCKKHGIDCSHLTKEIHKRIQALDMQAGKQQTATAKTQSKAPHHTFSWLKAAKGSSNNQISTSSRNSKLPASRGLSAGSRRG